MGWRGLAGLDILLGMTLSSDTSAQGVAAGEVDEVEDELRPAQEAEGEQADIGSTVRVRDVWGEEEYTLVGPTRSNAARGRISVESPVGRALLGRRRGERIEVHTPGGLRVLSILEVVGRESDFDHRSPGRSRP